MATFTPTRIQGGWRLVVPLDGTTVILEVESPHLDRGKVRATLTVRTGETIRYRDTVNLTSAGARARILAALAEKGIALSEHPLVALDESCRTASSPKGNPGGDTSPDISEMVPPLTLSELETRFRRWLLIRDHSFLPVLTGAVLAHRFLGEPVWLLIVAPPGGTKTEPLRSLYGTPGIFPLSSLTPRTFASGLDKPGADPSLLAQLNDDILVLKDLTTVLQMRREDRQTIFAQLREIYDGRFDMAWGTGRQVHWEGRLGLVAGVTPVIDRHHNAMAVLGERFVLFRPLMPDRRMMARAALDARGHETEMRRDLAAAMRGFLGARTTDAPAVSDDVLGRIATVADFVTRARSGVERDGYKRELEYAPEPEAPTRFAKVLLALGSGIACAYDSPAITDQHLRLVLRVALDSLPLIRQRVIGAVLAGTIRDDGEGQVSTSEIAGLAQVSTAAIRRTLEDLQALDVVGCVKAGPGKADVWALAPAWIEVFHDLTEDARSPAGEEKGDAPPDTSATVQATASERSGPPSRDEKDIPFADVCEAFPGARVVPGPLG